MLRAWRVVISSFQANGIIKLIDGMQVIGAFDLFNYLGMTRKAAEIRIYRLNRAGLIAPLGAEKAKWVLSVKCYEYLV